MHTYMCPCVCVCVFVWFSRDMSKTTMYTIHVYIKLVHNKNIFGKQKPKKLQLAS